MTDRFIKCLVWDLDNTLWSGTLLENGSCRLKPGIKNVLEELDKRGILHSIASSNDKDLAFSMLSRKGISEYFLHPQINWSNKTANLRLIADKLNIGLEAIGFVDDEPYEREQVRQILPSVSIYPAEVYSSLPNFPELSPMFQTEESSQRRKLYLQEASRNNAQKRSGKSFKEFLKSCQTRISIGEAKNTDLPRILELMNRTHQLNATGKIYCQEEIESFLASPSFRVYVVELNDIFVDYGKVGVAICACHPKKWRLVSFLLSCRVLARGIGYFFLAWLQHQAYLCGATEFEGIFLQQERNHRMQALYTLSGFRPNRHDNESSIIFSRKCRDNLVKPDWLSVRSRCR